jgi:hypothetical protein
MEPSAFIMEAIAGVICLVLGSRLYWRSRRSVQLSDSFIALALLTWALGYALYDIPYAFSQSDELIPPFFSYTSMLTFNLGNLVLAMFTQEVFRKHEHWAGWLIVAIAICMLLGSAGAAWADDWDLVYPLESPGYWPQTLADLAPQFWLGFEGLRYSFNARRRLALGLLEPFPCHRILLLGVAGALWAVLEIVIVVQDFIYNIMGDWSGALGVVNGLLEIVPISILWLAFFPPAFYRRWIEAAAPARMESGTVS